MKIAAENVKKVPIWKAEIDKAKEVQDKIVKIKSNIVEEKVRMVKLKEDLLSELTEAINKIKSALANDVPETRERVKKMRNEIKMLEKSEDFRMPGQLKLLEGQLRDTVRISFKIECFYLYHSLFSF